MIITTDIPKNLIEYPEDGNARINEPKFITINEIGEFSSSHFTHAFNRLLQEPQDIIPINVDSPGGSIISLMGIRDLIAASPKPVLTCTLSMAASCGAILLSLGTKGYRFASPNSVILIHEASTSTQGKTSDIMNEALYIEKLNDQLLELLATNSNKTKDFYKKLIKKANNADLFITPEEALSYGIIDAIGVPKITMKVSTSYEVEAVTPAKPTVSKRAKKA